MILLRKQIPFLFFIHILRKLYKIYFSISQNYYVFYIFYILNIDYSVFLNYFKLIFLLFLMLNIWFSDSLKRHRHSIPGHFSSYLAFLADLQQKVPPSTVPMFSTAVISGSTSAPDLRDNFPVSYPTSKNFVYIFSQILLVLIRWVITFCIVLFCLLVYLNDVCRCMYQFFHRFFIVFIFLNSNLLSNIFWIIICFH